MNGEECVMCPLCGKKMRLYDVSMVSWEQNMVWTCYGCGLRVPEKSAEAVMEALARKETGPAYPPGAEVAIGIEAAACDAIEAKIRDMKRICVEVQQMLAEAGNLYEPFMKNGPEDPRYRGWFDRMFEVGKSCHDLAREVGDHAHGLYSETALIARARMKKPEEEE